VTQKRKRRILTKMVKLETIDMVVEGGKASPGPAIAQKLGPMKINVGEVMKKVNDKTSAFKGMKVPVKIKVNPDDKSYDVEVGTPSTSELIKKEIGLEVGSARPDKEKVSIIGVESLLKIAKMKDDDIYALDIRKSLKTIAGSCNAMGVLVENMTAPEFNKKLEQGAFDKEIKAGITEVPAEKQKLFVDRRKELLSDIEKLRATEKAAAEAAEAKKLEEKAAAEAAAGKAPAAAKPGEEKASVPGEKAPAGAAPAAAGKAPAAGAAKPEEKKAPDTKKK